MTISFIPMKNATGILEGKKSGLYWTRMGETFVGIQSIGGEVTTKDFTRLEDCINHLTLAGERALDNGSVIDKVIVDLEKEITKLEKKYKLSRIEAIHKAQTALSYLRINQEY